MIINTQALLTVALACSTVTGLRPGTQDSAAHTVGPWRWIRDTIVRTVWKVPEYHQLPPTLKDPISRLPKVPSNVQARYGDQMVLRFELRSADDAAALAEAANTLMLDVWEFNEEWVDIRLAEDVVPLLLGLLPDSLQHAHRAMIPNLARTIFESYATDSETPSTERDGTFAPSMKAPPSDATNIFFRDYQPWSVIVPWMRLLRSMFPTHVRLVSVGTSFEGREILGLRVGVHPDNAEQPSGPRRTVVITGGAHAREWISTSTVSYVAYSLITAYGKSKLMTSLMEEFDFVFLPTINPDGYVYSWEEDRLWRKNRQQTSLPFCRGIDLDRSWDYEWDGDSPQNNPCYESYAGSEPFAAYETKQLSDWAKNETQNNGVQFVGFLDLHSYSEHIYFPFSYSCLSTPPDLENLEELAHGLAKAIRKTSGESYSVGAACEGNFATSADGNKKYFPRMESGGGSALDWFYHELKVHYSYQIKLRDTGSYGFLLPRHHIVPTGKEVYSAVIEFAKFYLQRHVQSEDTRPMTMEMLEQEEEALTAESETRHRASEQAFESQAFEAVEGAAEINWELKRKRR